LVVPGKEAHYVPRWERNVQEEAEPAAEALFLGGLPDGGGSHQKLVVVHPYDRGYI